MDYRMRAPLGAGLRLLRHLGMSVVDPGRNDDEDPPDERRGWWQSQHQSPGERIARCETNIDYLSKGADGLKKTLEALGDERRNAGRELMSTLERNQARTDDKLDALDKRLDFIEQERNEMKKFRRRLTGYAGGVSIVVGVGWQVASAVGPWLMRLFDRSTP